MSGLTNSLKPQPVVSSFVDRPPIPLVINGTYQGPPSQSHVPQTPTFPVPPHRALPKSSLPFNPSSQKPGQDKRYLSQISRYESDPLAYITGPENFDQNPKEKILLSTAHNIGDCFHPDNKHGLFFM